MYMYKTIQRDNCVGYELEMAFSLLQWATMDLHIGSPLESTHGDLHIHVNGPRHDAKPHRGPKVRLALWRAMKRISSRSNRQETVDMFYHGYDNYMNIAFPEDEVSLRLQERTILWR